MSDLMAGPRTKVERANKHIEELETVLGEFRDSDPYEVVGKEEPETGHDVNYLRVKVPLPAKSVSLIAGDVIHNLRSALDLLYCELVTANQKSVTKSDAFPISESRELFETGALPQIKRRISADALKVIEALKPYRGGQNAFWQLHQLDIIDKHRLLLTTTAGIGEILQTLPPFDEPVELPGVQIFGMKVAFKPATFRALNDGDEIYRQTTKPYQEVRFRFDVTLHEPPIVEGEPIHPFLHHLAGGTARVIDLFEPIV